MPYLYPAQTALYLYRVSSKLGSQKRECGSRSDLFFFLRKRVRNLNQLSKLQSRSAISSKLEKLKESKKLELEVVDRARKEIERESDLG